MKALSRKKSKPKTGISQELQRWKYRPEKTRRRKGLQPKTCSSSEEILQKAKA